MFPRHVGATRGIVSGRRREESRPRQEMSQAASVIFELETVLAAGPNDRRTEILKRMTDLFLGGAETFNNEQVGLFDGVLAYSDSNFGLSAGDKTERFAWRVKRKAQRPEAKDQRPKQEVSSCTPYSKTSVTPFAV